MENASNNLHIISAPNPILSHLLQTLIDLGDLDEISNTNEAISRYIIGNCEKTTTGYKVHKPISCFIYQTGCFRPQSGYRLLIIPAGMEFMTESWYAGRDYKEFIERLEREIIWGLTEIVMFGSIGTLD